MSIPHIHLLLQSPTAPSAWNAALSKHSLVDRVPHTIHACTLAELEDITFDLVVSPANSYGLLDGGFDDAISRAWSPPEDYLALTRAVQRQLYNSSCRGIVVPGTCEIVQIPPEFRGRLRYGDGTGWGCRLIAICPTMRTPIKLTHGADREVVYECIWSLLGKLAVRNQGGTEVRNILMTPLGTGVGCVSERKWAEQTALAIKHHLDSLQNPGAWQSIDWDKAYELAEEVEKTHRL